MEKTIDYISGETVNATPEEINSVQPISKQLVEIYGYKKSQITTHPQARISKSPSDIANSYPLDIAIYKDDKKRTEELEIIVECKSPDKKSGRKQLEKYMGLCPAQVGIWFNGLDQIVLLKTIDSKKQSFVYTELAFIPEAGSDLSNLDKQIFKNDLFKNLDLKFILNGLRNYLAGSEKGITQDSKFTEQIINLILCKIYDERETDLDKPLSFYSLINEDPKDTLDRINTIFKEVKKTFKDIFDSQDKIELTPKSLKHCVQALQRIYLMEASRDVIGDAFEVFIGPTLRGDKGQFFTPKNVVELVVSIIDPQINETVLDPACGAGGFLVSSLGHVWKKLDDSKTKKGWSAETTKQKKIEVAEKCFYGLEKDRFLTKIVKAYMAIMGDGKGGIFCENTLTDFKQYQSKTQERFSTVRSKFNCVIANPPYGKEIKIDDPEILKLYDLAYKYRNLEKTNSLSDFRTPQILFLEKIFNFLEEGGRAGIVLPEAMFGNTNDRYIMKYILDNIKVEGIVSLPVETFMPSTSVKTCVLFVRKESAITKNYKIFMSKVTYVGHDKDSKPIYKSDGTINDELPETVSKFQEFQKTNRIKAPSRVGFTINKSDIENYRLTPHFYDNKVSYLKNQRYVSLQALVDTGVVAIETGMEIGSANYTPTGVPFVRTSDIGNYEINYRTSKYMPQGHYDSIKHKCDIKHKDILFVIDGQADSHKGNGLMGTTAMVLQNYGDLIIQSHIASIRVLPNNSLSLTPEAMMYLLNEITVKEQIYKYNKVEGGLSGLNNQLYEIKIRVPDINELDIIHHQMDLMFSQKEASLQIARNISKQHREVHGSNA
ncbi:N-6 DNA methylase [Delftia acidovorans]|uniref:N-6 DNA methylase n=1 Tax=Delftia acidovorans TaxID=80866 RepID=UPI00242FCAC9|nr:N-6 DNA methylase [Delftia acidovorans]